MKKLNYKVRVGLILLLLFSNSCNEDFLSVTPNGSLDAEVLANAKGVDALLIGTYSMLDGVASNGFGWEAASSNWVYGSIRALEANKGSDAGDASGINPIQNFTETATNPFLHVKWRSLYDGISRANSVLAVLASAEEKGTVTEAEADSFRKQARTLRGFFHFEAWRMWSKADGSGIPYVDENTDLSAVTNFNDVRNQILADLEAGTTLPDNMTNIGRFNGTVARVLYAKALMQMKKDFNTAKTFLESVKISGKKPNGAAIGLDPKYGEIFDAANRNSSPEAVYTIQYSVNDGSGGWNAGWGEVLNFPYKGGASP
ncbi:MAG: RagB/SusD family nutrient uptake outer membrane protein, partial [Cyclobacteriaceae bacterium]|nr:RagB/SusD family nutrient uptake outer membrane protein [Cyclobacteriaceae bacterium]